MWYVKKFSWEKFPKLPGTWLGDEKIKITQMWRRWGMPQNLFLVFINEIEKQLFIKKSCWSGPIKKVRILIFTMLYFLKKYRKTPGDIIILHLCTKNLDYMIYSYWDIEYDRLELVIWVMFCSFTLPPPLKTRKI